MIDRYGRDWVEVSARGKDRVFVYGGLKIGFPVETSDEKIIEVLEAHLTDDVAKGVSPPTVDEYFAALKNAEIEALGLAAVVRILAAGR